MDRLRPAQKAEVQTRLACWMLRRRCGQHRKSFFRQLACVLAHGRKLRLDATQLFLERLTVKKFLNVVEFLLVELGFKWAAARHHNYLFRRLLWRIDHQPDRKSTRLNSSHGYISYAVFCLK